MADITFPKELIQRLEAIAAQENRTPADVLSSMIDRYPAQEKAPERDPAEDEYYSVRQVILRVYERARRYWREHGETEKANMTDAEMDEQFWLIDQDGIPRLKSEQGQVELLPGSLRDYAAHVAQHGTFSSGKTDTAERSREILNEEYADYLLRRMDDNP